MQVNTQTAVGCLLVEKLTDVSWAVRTPDADWTCVEECDDPTYDGVYQGYLGERFAIDAVLDAEQMADESELAAA